jgi:hypothetical protein
MSSKTYRHGPVHSEAQTASHKTVDGRPLATQPLRNWTLSQPSRFPAVPSYDQKNKAETQSQERKVKGPLPALNFIALSALFYLTESAVFAILHGSGQFRPDEPRRVKMTLKVSFTLRLWIGSLKIELIW